MDVKCILQELLSTTQQQVSSVISGDHNRLLSLSQKHEALLKEAGPAFRQIAEEAQNQQPEVEIMELMAELDHTHTILKELLQRESFRVNTQIRILAGTPPQGNYPGGKRPAQTASLLNTKA